MTTKFTQKQQLGLALILAMGATAAGAQNTSAPFTLSGSLEAGTEYTNNVTINEIEAASGESDMSAVVDAALNLNWKPSAELNVDAGYNLSTQRYDDIDVFDLDKHQLYGDVSYDLNQITVGANFYYTDAQLDGGDFYKTRQQSVYAVKALNNNLTLRGALNFGDKDFDWLGARDADTEGVSVDAIWNLNQGQSNLKVGYAYHDEDARVNAFAYDADILHARFTHRFGWNGREANLQLGGQAQFRDYKGITPSIGRTRDDHQYIVDARVEVKLMPWLAVFGNVERVDFRSHLASADYTQNRIGAGLKLDF